MEKKVSGGSIDRGELLILIWFCEIIFLLVVCGGVELIFINSISITQNYQSYESCR